jgi:hypothetical protein
LYAARRNARFREYPKRNGDAERKRRSKPMKKTIATIFLSVFLFGCAATPLRPARNEDPKVPAGNIEGNRFHGIRYPFLVSAPPHWRMTTEFPDFMEGLGFNRPLPADREQTELYAYHPETKSNIHFDVTPATPFATFDQRTIEQLTTAATDSLKSELEEQHGKGVVNVEVGPTEPFSLKGVQYAAKKHVTYVQDGVKWEQGWIYGFGEPYQIFIVYMIRDTDGANDRRDIQGMADSFTLVRKP